jgi:hypothetical protein
MEQSERKNMGKRISQEQLEHLAASLPSRDLDVLCDIEARRYMTSRQIRTLRFGNASTLNSARCISNRAIGRLKGNGLIAVVSRRRGGCKGGDGGCVWTLTAAGARLLHLGRGERLPKRNFAPSQRFAEHTLAIAELDIQLRHIDGVIVTEVQFEPECWREYGGKSLKPDYYAVTTDGEYEDFWFFEIDLATEAPSRVVAKCEQYQAYFRSGTEQRDTGIFPRVVWVVPDSVRKETVQGYIRRSKELKEKHLFLVILPDELENLIREGVKL